MINLFDRELARIDKLIPSAPPSDVPALFRPVPLDVFGELLLDVPGRYPNLRAFLPSMAPAEVQRSWTGSDGVALLTQSLAFMKSLVSGYEAATGKKIGDAVTLDYGCGWGRLIRLLYKVMPLDNIHGVDPWDKSIELCKQHAIKCNLAISDYIPKTLPFERQFDLIFAFSVFTHLSERTTLTVFETLRKYIKPDGLLAITIRPKEYWPFAEGQKTVRSAIELMLKHDTTGFAFNPHDRAPVDGEITYGDTSISIPYLSSKVPNWKVAGLDYNIGDYLQVIVFLRPV